MKQELIDRLREETERICRFIKNNLALGLDGLTESLEKKGYVVAGTEPLRVYGPSIHNGEIDCTPLVEWNSGNPVRYVKLTYRFSPEYPIETLLKPDGTQLSEFYKVQREDALKTSVYDRFGLQLDIKNEELILSLETPLENLKEKEMDFKNSIEQAKEYLEKIRYTI
ncbi:hypothetical protein DRJ16_02280 [Candidatus Woesearchaeota archaeon]|nr:MAG: hypothetical protein DRJ16_02280 [Candidatus Woesearchaeota archaeon]